MIQFDPGSFKDPAGRVFVHEGRVCRTLSPAARAAFEAASRRGLIAGLVRDGLLPDTALVPARELNLDPALVGEVVLAQARVPLVSYSYEWSFEMLRDAALVTLRVLDRALAEGYILKDANAFNILFHGTQPRLVDTASIEPYREGQLWTGYAQFCRSFLFPLLLASYRDIAFQPILRGTLGELPVHEAVRMFRVRDYLRPGVWKDVVLQSMLDRSFAGAQDHVKATASGRSYPKALLVANVRRLTGLIEGLRASSTASEWSAYDATHSYNEADRAAKATFVADVVAGRRWIRVADLGCNIGTFSDVAIAAGASVVAVDLDSRAIDRLYRSHPSHSALSPVVATLLNPTPAQGWGLRERRSLLERVEADGFLALALIHHLRITGGVPLEAIIAQLFQIAREGIIEWVDKSDAKVARLLGLRDDVYDDYSWSSFESLVKRSGAILAVRDTHDGQRRLCHVRAHG